MWYEDSQTYTERIMAFELNKKSYKDNWFKETLCNKKAPTIDYLK